MGPTGCSGARKRIVPLAVQAGAGQVVGEGEVLGVLLQGLQQQAGNQTPTGMDGPHEGRPRRHPGSERLPAQGPAPRGESRAHPAEIAARTGYATNLLVTGPPTAS